MKRYFYQCPKKPDKHQVMITSKKEPKEVICSSCTKTKEIIEMEYRWHDEA